MGKKTAPEIKKCKDEDFTCITFTPDYKRFGECAAHMPSRLGVTASDPICVL
jgi:hypothetical protein